MSKEHWEKIYTSKEDNEVSWYQDIPRTSIEVVKKTANSQSDSIIDIGGGNSNLASELMKLNFLDISVLDISEASLNRTKEKLGEKAKNINWYVSDVLGFEPPKKFDIWHDRAVFHFVTGQFDKNAYVQKIKNSLKENGILILATFSKEGPTKCSGLEICQYDKDSLTPLFGKDFDLVDLFKEEHTTPFNTTQNFIYTVWKKKV